LINRGDVEIAERRPNRINRRRTQIIGDPGSDESRTALIALELLDLTERHPIGLLFDAVAPSYGRPSAFIGG
jgi:hypothetical protein